MNNKAKKVLIFTLTAIMSVASLNGCGKGKSDVSTSEVEDEKPVALVIIAGRHANAKMYTEDMISRAKEYIEDSYVVSRDSSGYVGTAQVSVIVSDGNPSEVAVELDGKDILTYTSGNASDINAQKSNLVSDITEFLMSPSLKADDEEVDLLLALSRAQDILDDYPDSEHHILVLDTGITTAGELNMNVINILEGECSDIISQIKSGIPRLNGTEVTFLGLGNVASTQDSITTTEGKERLEKLWASIIETGEGTLTPNCLNYRDSENTAEMLYSEDGGNDVYKYVSSVSFYNTSEGGLEPTGCALTPDEKSNEPTVTLAFETSDLGGFVPDEATFLHKDVAISTLNKMSADLSEFLSKTDDKLYIIGSSAKVTPGDNSSTDTVSTDRAKAVADLLINDYNVPADRIISIGAGATKFSWRNANEYPDGTDASYNKTAAQKNRVVAIISENSVLMDELKSGGYVK